MYILILGSFMLPYVITVRSLAGQRLEAPCRRTVVLKGLVTRNSLGSGMVHGRDEQSVGSLIDRWTAARPEFLLVLAANSYRNPKLAHTTRRQRN